MLVQLADIHRRLFARELADAFDHLLLVVGLTAQPDLVWIETGRPERVVPAAEVAHARVHELVGRLAERERFTRAMEIEDVLDDAILVPALFDMGRARG